MPALPWRALVVWSAIGTVLTAGLVAGDLDRRSAETMAIDLIQGDLQGPPRAALLEDFPRVKALGVDTVEHDGQLYYAVARAPMHLDEAAENLDRPHYRLQRPLFPLLAWLLHPFGGGPGLVAAMFLVGVAALFGGGVATGALSVTLGGPRWLALAFPVLPGSLVSLRLSTADPLAVALTVAGLAAFLRGRVPLATLFAIGAVLTRESSLLAFIGLLLWRRDRQTLAIAAASAAAAGALAVFLRAAVEVTEPQVIELRAPFDGWLAAWRYWRGVLDAGMVEPAVPTLILAIAVAIGGAMLGGRRSPLTWPIALHLGLLTIITPAAIAFQRNAPRVTLPLLTLGAVAVVTALRTRDGASGPPVTGPRRTGRRPRPKGRASPGAGAG